MKWIEKALVRGDFSKKNLLYLLLNFVLNTLFFIFVNHFFRSAYFMRRLLIRGRKDIEVLYEHSLLQGIRLPESKKTV